MENHLRTIIETLADKDVEFILCGGVAAILHGVPRITLDIDVSLEWTSDNVHRFLQAMDELSLSPRVPLPPEVIMDTQAVKKMVEEKNAIVFTFIDKSDPLRHVDVFLTQNLSYDTLKNHVVRHMLGSIEVNVISAEYLLQLKEAIEPPRDKDLLDIKTLRRLVEQDDRPSETT